MGIESLDKLEERISKAVAHIEKLNELKKKLEEENMQLRDKVGELERELHDRQQKIAVTEKQSAKVSERVKEKIEGLLDRIESYEQSLS